MTEQLNKTEQCDASAVFREIDILIRARYPILYLLTYEESRVEKFILDLANSHSKKLFVWTATQGLVQRSGYGNVVANDGAESRLNDPIELLKEIRKEKSPALFLLKDFHPFLDDPHVVRLVRDTASALKNSFKTIAIVSPRLNLPPELEKEVTLIDIPLPSTNELLFLLQSVCATLQKKDPKLVQLTSADIQIMVKAAQGLTLSEAENVFAKAVVRDAVLDQRDIDLVLREKEQIIRKSGILEFFPSQSKMQDVGGLDRLKEWLKIRGKAFTSEAAKFGLPIPKGVLLLGVPGCGKSLTAKAIANYWRMPLLRMDLGRIFSGLVGSSEENMRKAIKVAESIAPAILWIDEIEKGLSGNSNGNSDSGTAARVFGTLLTWMQEKEANVFVVATANSISSLPPELLRRGRFDEIFFTDLPSPTGRKEILSIHLIKRGRRPEKFDLDQLLGVTEEFSGAELEHCIMEALFLSFHERRDLKTEDLLRVAKDTIPLSKVYAEELKKLRAWAITRARFAESQPTQAGNQVTHLEVKGISKKGIAS